MEDLMKLTCVMNNDNIDKFIIITLVFNPNNTEDLIIAIIYIQCDNIIIIYLFYHKLIYVII